MPDHDPAPDPDTLPPVVRLHFAAARELGFTGRVLDPEYGLLFELSNGQKSRVFLGGRSPLNDATAARLASDKHYTGLLLAGRGFRVPRTVRCLKPGYFTHQRYEGQASLEPGLALAEELGYPVMVKPNRKSHGREVTRVDDAEALARAVKRVWAIDYLALVQERIPGVDLRLDFLDGDFLIGYERRPAASEAAAGDLEVLNLNRGAEPVLIRELPPAWLEWGLAAGAALGLVHFGIDCRGARLDQPPGGATILELNASPLLVRLWQMGYDGEAVAAQARVLRLALDST